MRVFRHRHVLGCLAVFALAMQVVLAFAATHAHSYARAGLDRLAARAITFGMCRPDGQKRCQPSVPHNGHDGCELCLSIAMAGTGVLQAPPAVLPVEPVFVTLGPSRVVPLVAGEAHRHFQARAPPLA